MPKVSVWLGNTKTSAAARWAASVAAFHLPEEPGVRKAGAQLRFLRTVADDHLGARQIEREERLEVLLDRDSPDADEARPRQIEVDCALGREELGVHAAGPQPEIFEAAACQFGHERRVATMVTLAGAVEAPQRGVGPALGDREARAMYLGKAGRIAGRERQSAR